MSWPETKTLLREARPEDVDALLELWREADAVPSVTDTREDVNSVMAADCARLLVAEVEGQLIGSVIGTFDGWRGNIYRLAVHPGYRRRGLGRALLDAVERWMAQRGARRITALVERAHPWAVGFWDAAGYSLDQRIARYVRNLSPRTS